MSIIINMAKFEIPKRPCPLMDAALAKRLMALREADDCCQNLDAIVAAAQNAPQLDTKRAHYEALADEKRLLAVAMIKRRPDLCGCEVQAGLGVAHATVSHHMRVLVDAGLVTVERRGRWAHYRLTASGDALAP